MVCTVCLDLRRVQPIALMRHNSCEARQPISKLRRPGAWLDKGDVDGPCEAGTRLASQQ